MYPQTAELLRPFSFQQTRKLEDEDVEDREADRQTGWALWWKSTDPSTSVPPHIIDKNPRTDGGRLGHCGCTKVGFSISLIFLFIFILYSVQRLKPSSLIGTSTIQISPCHHAAPLPIQSFPTWYAGNTLSYLSYLGQREQRSDGGVLFRHALSL